MLAQLEVPLDVGDRGVRRRQATGRDDDPQPRPGDARCPSELLAVTDVIVPNEHEIELVGGVDALLDRGRVDGDRHPRRLGRGGRPRPTTTPPRRIPRIAVEPIDTTGAGDAFCGALAARLAAGDGLDDAVRWAIVAGGLATTRPRGDPVDPRRGRDRGASVGLTCRVRRAR